MRKLAVILVLVGAMSALSWSVGHVYSQDKGAGVAGGARVARGKNDTARPSAKPRPAAPVPTDSSEETSGVSSRRIREIESLEQQCLEEINRVRRHSGLPRLAFYEDLLPVARDYSRRMAEEHFFSHNDPDGKTVRERVDEAEIRWRMVGENLAYSNGYVNPVAASLHGWMESPGHRKNILEADFTMTAIGVWIKDDGTVYFTEIFLKQ